MVSGRPLSMHVDKLNPTGGVVNLTYSVQQEELVLKENLEETKTQALDFRMNTIIEQPVSSEGGQENDTNLTLDENTNQNGPIVNDTLSNGPVRTEIKENNISNVPVVNNPNLNLQLQNKPNLVNPQLNLRMINPQTMMGQGGSSQMTGFPAYGMPMGMQNNPYMNMGGMHNVPKMNMPNMPGISNLHNMQSNMPNMSNISNVPNMQNMSNIHPMQNFPSNLQGVPQGMQPNMQNMQNMQMSFPQNMSQNIPQNMNYNYGNIRQPMNPQFVNNSGSFNQPQNQYLPNSFIPNQPNLITGNNQQMNQMNSQKNFGQSLPQPAQNSTEVYNNNAQQNNGSQSTGAPSNNINLLTNIVQAFNTLHKLGQNQNQANDKSKDPRTRKKKN